jgi:hypothetical protein
LQLLRRAPRFTQSALLLDLAVVVDSHRVPAFAPRRVHGVGRQTSRDSTFD